jgi:integrase
MLNSANPNHPKKGSRITVQPIRRESDIKSIKQYLKNDYRDLLLFTMGINNGLRISDLLKLKVGQVRTLRTGEYLVIREQKTGKDNVLMINKAVKSTLEAFLKDTKPSDEEYLFKSKKGNNQPLKREAVHRKIKGWGRLFKIKENIGSHSLRKTWGYMQRTKYGVGFEILCKRFSHSSPAVTMRYLGIEDKEVNGILLNEI